MWIRTIKVTFANELMKKSVRSYFSDNIDASLGQLVTYSVDLNNGPVWSFKVAGDITLDTLTKGVSPHYRL